MIVPKNVTEMELFPDKPGEATLHILPPSISLYHPLREGVENLRDRCYCDLLRWEPRNYWGRGSDRFDLFASYGYVTVQGRGKACFRLIPSDTPNYRLPIEIEFGITLPRPRVEISRVIMAGGKSPHLIDGFYRGMCMTISSREIWRGYEMGACIVAQPHIFNELQRRFGESSIRQVPGTGVVEKITPTGKAFPHVAGEISVEGWKSLYENQRTPISLVA